MLICLDSRQRENARTQIGQKHRRTWKRKKPDKSRYKRQNPVTNKMQEDEEMEPALPHRAKSVTNGKVESVEEIQHPSHEDEQEI